MYEKLVVAHDPSVYVALRKQARFNRRVTLFMLATTVWFLHEQIKKKNEDGSPYFSVTLTKNDQAREGE